jgi:aminopeptidase N
MTVMPSLTRTEARTRASLLDVHSYSVDLDLTRGPEVFGSSSVIRFGCAEPGATTFLEIRPAAVRRIVLNGRELDAALLGDGRITLSGLAAENELRVEADMRYSRTGEGMHTFTDPADDETYVYAMCGPDQAPTIFACFDQPDLKAAIEVAVTAPEHWTVLSNGAVARHEGGRWEFAPTQPISTYLATVVGGPLHSVRAEHDGIPLGLHCRRSLAPYLDADAEELLELTRRAFDRYHELFDERYPFGTYDQAFVPEFNFGAVENPGCVTFRDTYLFRSAVTDAERETRAVVIAHEMAHMWFGDLVTMRWWDDLWLNESFAEYMGYQVVTEVSRFTDAWTTFCVSRGPWGYDADQRPSTHPVAVSGLDDTDAALANFDGISYAKGAAALRQLVAWIGEEAFLAGVNDHFARHRFGNADLSDLLDALSRSSGRDVHGWAELWLCTSGVDTLRAEAADGDEELSAVQVVHTGPASGKAVRRPHRIEAGAYDLTEGRLVARERFGLEVTAGPDDGGPARTALSVPSGTRRPDLLLLNDRDLGYLKIRLDERSWITAAGALSTATDPLTRALLWTTVRDMVRDAELPAEEFVALTEAHLPSEPMVAIVETVLAFGLRQVADRYLPSDRRGPALATLAGVCRELLRRGGPDTGVRLAAVRGLIPCTDPGELREWLRDGRVPGGPRLDPELRWKILVRLCALGAAGPEEIDAELAGDRSAVGLEGAARCRAALPDPDAKERAWRELFDGTLSNNLVGATASGFWQPSRPEPTAGFVERYFADVPAAGARSPMLARILARDLFPAYAVDERTVRAAEACLARDDLTSTLRRSLDDELDDLRRALRVRDAGR